MTEQTSSAAPIGDVKLPDDLRAYADREQTHNGLVLAHGETLRLAADELDEARRVVAAARWYVRCIEFGLRTDCSWFELRAAVKAIAPEEVADDDSA